MVLVFAHSEDSVDQFLILYSETMAVLNFDHFTEIMNDLGLDVDNV